MVSAQDIGYTPRHQQPPRTATPTPTDLGYIKPERIASASIPFLRYDDILVLSNDRKYFVFWSNQFILWKCLSVLPLVGKLAFVKPAVRRGLKGWKSISTAAVVWRNRIDGTMVKVLAVWSGRPSSIQAPVAWHLPALRANSTEPLPSRAIIWNF